MSEEKRNPLEEPIEAPAEVEEASGEDWKNFHPADAADHLEDLSLEQQLEVVGEMGVEEAANSIAEMEKHDRSELLDGLSLGLAADILQEMSPDDAADALYDLDEPKQNEILSKVKRDHAARIKRLMKYDSDTAGGVMNTEILYLDQNLSVDQAVNLIRKEIGEMEIPYYGFIVDQNDKIVGVVSLRELLMAKTGTRLKNLIKDQVLVSVTFDVHQEEVARLIKHYNLLALPVTDYEGKLLGVVTVDDVIDIIHEEASEDMQVMVGAGPDETVDSPWTYSVKKRLPWLVINVINSAVAAMVVAFFEGTIAQMAVLAVLMPIVANQAGNTGHQAMVVMIRQLAMEKFDRKKVWIAVLREAKIGVVNGLFIGVLVFFGVFLWTDTVPLALVMSAALCADMVIGSLAGASIPLILKELGRDPAQASSILLTTLTDSAGFFALLGLAAVFLLAG